MNICFFNWQESTGVAADGGIRRASSLIAKELRRRGHNVEFYYSPPRFPIPVVSTFLPLFLPSLAKQFCADGARFRQFLEEHKIDVAVWFAFGRIIPFSLNALPCRLVTTWRGAPVLSEQIYADEMVKKLRLRSRLAQRMVCSKFCRFLLGKSYKICYSHLFSYALRHSKKFVLLSERFIPEFPLSKKFQGKVCAIPNITTYGAQSVPFDEKKKELLWVARVVFPKRPDLMLQIWQKLQDRFPDWSLRFVGDGEYLPELKALASSLGVKNVSFEGFQDPTPYYRSASIFCMTSAYEGFPNVLPEAQALGCVPIAFESFSSVRDIIDDGVNGFLVTPFDLDAYAGKLAQLMSNSELWMRLALNAQKSIAKFSPEAIGDKWEKLLLEEVTD